jgi:hypothetical protein
MIMMNGWIKLHRRLLGHARAGDPEWVAVWVRLLMSAAFRRHVAVWRGQKIKLRPGELVTSGREIALAAGVAYHKTRRILRWMEADNQILVETDRGKSMIKILNWRDYQGKTGGAEIGADDDGGSGCGITGWIWKNFKTAQPEAQKPGGAAIGAGIDAGGGAAGDGVNGLNASGNGDQKNESAQPEAQQSAQQSAQLDALHNKKEEERIKEEQKARARRAGGGDQTDQGGNDMKLEEWQELHRGFCGSHPQCAAVPEMAFVAKCRALGASSAAAIRAAIVELGMDYAGSAFGPSAPPLRVLGWYLERGMDPQKKDRPAGHQPAERRVFVGYGDEDLSAGPDAEKKNGAAGQAPENGGSHAGG